MSADSLILLNGLLRTKFWGGFLRLRFAMAGLRGTSGSSFFFSDVSTAPQGEARPRVGREGCCKSMQKGKSRSASDAYLVGLGSFPQTYQQNCENRMGAGLSRGRMSAGADTDTSIQTLSGTGQTSPNIWLCREPRVIHGV